MSVYQIFFSWENKYGTDGLVNTLMWAFGEFVDFNANRYSDSENWYTIRTLMSTHIYFPESFEGWLFGKSGSWISMNPKGDLGYIRILYTNGLIGSFLLYGGFATIFALGFLKAEQRYRALFMTLGLYLFIAEAKEPFLTKFSVPTICLILLMNIKRQDPSISSVEKYKSITGN